LTEFHKKFGDLSKNVFWSRICYVVLVKKAYMLTIQIRDFIFLVKQGSREPLIDNINCHSLPTGQADAYIPPILIPL